MPDQNDPSSPFPIQTLAFDGDDLDVVPSEGEHWVLLSTLCAPFELDTDGQRRKLVALPWATTKIILAVAGDGKVRKVFCVNIRSVAGWLFTLNPGKVAAHLQDKLVRYQCECAERLADHFLGRRNHQDVHLLARKYQRENTLLRRANVVLAARLEVYEDQHSPGVIGTLRASLCILHLVAHAARLECAAEGDLSPNALRSASKRLENEVRTYARFPQGRGQSWDMLPIDKLGDAFGKAVQLKASAEDRLRRMKRRRKGDDQGNLFPPKDD